MRFIDVNLDSTVKLDIGPGTVGKCVNSCIDQ